MYKSRKIANITAFSLLFFSLFIFIQSRAAAYSSPTKTTSLQHKETVIIQTGGNSLNSCTRGRVEIVNNQLVADNGQRLRGERDDALYENGLSWHDLANTYHLNTMRIFLYQEPQNWPGGCGWDCAWIPSIEENIAHIDEIVNEAAANGFYVIIDYHSVGGLDPAAAMAWWSVIAPRYEGQTHVIYEVANEPVAWGPNDYDADDIAAQEDLYNLIRGLAPNTHLIQWTFANATSGMVEKVNQGTAINYSNASVGFHPYQFDINAYNALQASYAAINTEIGGLNDGEYQSRTAQAESLGVSWIWLDGVLHPIPVTWSADPITDACVNGAGIPAVVTIPGRIEAENYGVGGQGVGYNDSTTGNTGGAYRSDDVDIQTTADTSGAYNVGWTTGGEWLAFAIQVTQTGNYDFRARVASGNTGTKTLHIEVDGVNVTGPMSFSSEAGWQSWLNLYARDVYLTAGVHQLRIVFDTGTTNLNYVEVTGAAPDLPYKYWLPLILLVRWWSGGGFSDGWE